MITHEQIWQGVDRLAKTFGYSPSGLAKQAGLDPTSFNKSKRTSPDGKPRWPSTESISKILAVTGATMSEFIGLIDDKASDPVAIKDIPYQTAKILLDTKSVLLNAKEPFSLKSGRKSPAYIDVRRLISFVEERNAIIDFSARVIEKEIGGDNIDYVAGGETAGIPYGSLIASQMQKPMVYVRKEPKGYGRMAQIEGVLPEKSKPKTLLVEDLQTDGGSKQIFINALREADAEVSHAFVIFHYGIFKQSEKNMKNMGVKLHALCTWWDILEVARKEKYFDAATLTAVEKFLKSPDDWQ